MQVSGAFEAMAFQKIQGDCVQRVDTRNHHMLARSFSSLQQRTQQLSPYTLTPRRRVDMNRSFHREAIPRPAPKVPQT